MSLDQVLTGLQIAVAVFILVLLYHVLFIAVDLRKILRRVDLISKQLEDAIMKPISMVDCIFQWIMDFIEEDKKKKGGRKKKT